MRTQRQNPEQGFSLMELMVAMALGLLVMTAMASLFKSGMNSVMLVTQRAENQQDMRAAVDMMTKDLSLAGAGLPSGGIQLPTGVGSSLSKFGCDQGGTCHITSFNYPGNYMYGIIPGYLDGVEAGAVIPMAPAPAVNDAVTVVYCDYGFPYLFENTVTINATGTSVTFTPSVAYPSPPLITAAGGIQKGDLIMFSNNLGTAVGEATTVSNAGTTGTIAFTDLDPLNINQSTATFNNIKAIAGGANTVAYRLFAVTYYLTVPAAGQTPRLMRQINGLTPVPVADDIINLQVAYDTYNTTTGALDANQANPLGVGESPNNIQKINLVVMGQSIINNGNKSQNMYLATDISARNMAFRNVY
ncbi:MAG TPA: prepilin-type N-terminal cleavage/methylation domain-containing protein [Candidatus Sulfotelmatobacter sp.]|nr:prepilin-type N-terminal cleavage/methylation domain-containing protein [Candidatus Sulfotelmatobacter sp.]